MYPSRFACVCKFILCLGRKHATRRTIPGPSTPLVVVTTRRHQEAAASPSGVKTALCLPGVVSGGGGGCFISQLCSRTALLQHHPANLLAQRPPGPTPEFPTQGVSPKVLRDADPLFKNRRVRRTKEFSWRASGT